MNQKLNKSERLKSKKDIGLLFKDRNNVTVYPLRLFWKINTKKNTRIAFSVSKKLYKKAVDRNKIKRKLRELYRLNKNYFDQINKIEEKNLDLMLIFSGKKVSSQEEIAFSYKKLISKLAKSISKT